MADAIKLAARTQQKISEMTQSLGLKPEEHQFAYEMALRMADHTLKAYVEELKVVPTIGNKALSAVFAYGLIVTNDMVTQRQEAKKKSNN